MRYSNKPRRDVDHRARHKRAAIAKAIDKGRVTRAELVSLVLFANIRLEFTDDQMLNSLSHHYGVVFTKATDPTQGYIVK